MPIEPLTPRPDPPGEGYSSKVVTSVGRQRFELTVRVESREIVRGPADVIEMPKPAAGVEPGANVRTAKP